MRIFNQIQKVFIKTSNSSKKISLRYTYSLIFIFVLTVILYLILDYKNESILLIKNCFLSLITIILSAYIINIMKKKTNFLLIFHDNNILSLSLIISLFSKSSLTSTVIFASFLTALVRGINSNRNLSASLYGILYIYIYNVYFANHLYIDIENYKVIDYFINPNFISPILAILAFIYLFNHKSIKYNVVLSYIFTFFLGIFLYTFVNKNDFLEMLLTFIINSPLFLSVYLLPDYKMTPTIAEAQIVYGIIAGMMSLIIYFLFPNLAFILPMIILPILLTGYLEKLSPRLKYNSALYHSLVTVCLLIVILVVSVW